MATANTPEVSLRLEPGGYKRLGLAFAISAAIHIVICLSIAGKLQWVTKVLPGWLRPDKVLAGLLVKNAPRKPPPEPEVPTVFVDVSPEQAVTQAPKKSEYYSDKNSRAANPETTVDTQTPRIDGRQTDITKTEDIPRSRMFPLSPSVAQKNKEEQAETTAKPRYTPGDLTLAKPQPTPKKSTGEDKQDRPRTLKEAHAREPDNRLVGPQMKQEGGVKQRSRLASLDVTATGFGEYDAALIAAVQNRWYDLLDSRNYAGLQTGKVTLKFHLNADGSISELSFVDSTVDLAQGMLCQSAIKDPAPYAPWPSDMRRKIGDSFREVTFTFFYY